MCTDNPSPTYTEEFRRQCEARLVASLPPWERKDYLAFVWEHRGHVAHRALLDEIERVTA